MVGEAELAEQEDGVRVLHNGAVDGKHVQIEASPHSGSQYLNYKGTYSIVLMAVVDSQLRFVCIDVGAYGSQSDGGVFKASKIGKLLSQGALNLPPPQLLPLSTAVAPCVFVGDEAFQVEARLPAAVPWQVPRRGPAPL
ncbi:hypothetical protein HPB49_005458 [Dermacentor silvarum]|uniref:Uncharacterized protein n=1 Tax=Dermacentor silvarum TaxID=543639 RepID=A0ACB8CPY6_DERSI|nr:hypothetical protein HPB49_005458 [Dermacentor silvarum]